MITANGKLPPERDPVFAIGDMVELKSGGPPMTVMCADCVDVECWWFVKGGRLQRRQFHRKTLMPWDGPNIPF